MLETIKKNDSKYIQLRQSLRHFITSNPPGTRLPSYAEMIRIYGVGQSTIDRAMKEFDEAKLILREHGRGMFISPRAGQKNIAIIFGRNLFSAGSSPVNQHFLKFAEARSRESNENARFFINMPQVEAEGYDLMVQRDLQDALNSGSLSGAVLLCSRGEKEVKWLVGKKIPLVVVSCNPGAACVIANDTAELVRLATESLVRQGCRRIAFLTVLGLHRIRGYYEDIDAYREVLARHHLETKPEWIWDKAEKQSQESSEIAVSNEMIGNQAAHDLLSNTPLEFDGLVSMDDMTTRGFLAGMRKFNLSPGRDLKIATHVNHDVPVLFGYEHDVTMIEFDPEKLVNEAFSLLDRLMSGETIPPGTVIKIKDGIKEVDNLQIKQGATR